MKVNEKLFYNEMIKILISICFLSKRRNYVTSKKVFTLDNRVHFLGLRVFQQLNDDIISALLSLKS